MRLSAASWVKVQSARTEGLLQSVVRLRTTAASSFAGVGDPLWSTAMPMPIAPMSASACRTSSEHEGDVSLYGQDVEAGYSAPGMETLTDTKPMAARSTFR